MAAVPVTLVVPTLNGGALFRRLLERVAAGSPRPARFLVIDSGSADGSAEAAERAGAELLRIDRADFDHGATRQAAVERADTELVAFLSQDAVPEPGWLGPLHAAFADPGVAGATARILPREDSSALARRTARASPLAAAVPRVVRVEPAAFRALDRGERRAYCLFDNVASMARRALLLRHPFPRTMMGEDQAFAEAVLLEGHALAFVPASVVRHAHEYGPLGAFRRYRDDARFVRARFGRRVRRGLLDVVKGVLHEVREDARSLRSERLPSRLAALGRSPLLRCGQVLGQWWGSNVGAAP
jgi:rhamnosyltransferase